ncbi:MAG: hypothetical protein ACE5MM_03610 [Nitrospiraceae bacterium]
MRTVGSGPSACGLCIGIWLAIWSPSPASGQREHFPELVPPGSPPFESQLKLLHFQSPTTIEGRLRYVDLAEQAIWLDWDRRLEEQPSGEKAWRELAGDFMLLVYPSDQSQFDALKTLKPGTQLRLVIQSNDVGHRLILSYSDASVPPEVPL